MLSRASFKRRAPLEEAPNFADCLTSVYYIFKNAVGVEIPLTFIGDMPRQLQCLGDWKCLKVDIKDIRCGDVLFLKDKEHKTSIRHAALVMDVDRIFHCCQKVGKPTIQSVDDFFSKYEQTLTFKEMMRYIDSRNTELLTKSKSGYISD